MTPANDDGRALRLVPQEWLFLGAVILFWAAFVIVLGKDTSWDFRNYHWYIPYAFLNGRMSFDVAVAHAATYYNPLVDVPFYWLGVHTPAWFALGIMGAVQGGNVIPLYIIARQSLLFPDNRIAAAALAALGMTGGLTVLAGTTYYDNVLSVFTLSSLAILIASRSTLIAGPLLRVAIVAAIAGFVCGTAAGLKLPETPFTLGFAAALIALGGDWRHQMTRVLAGGFGGFIGFFIFGGLWMIAMNHLTGNPLFPYFNDHFHSELASFTDFHDTRFLQPFKNEIILPILFSLDWRMTDDLPYQDIRIGLAYLMLIAAAIGWVVARFKNRKPSDPLMDPIAARAIVAFAIVSFIVWVKLFCIYRYILSLEMLAPIVIALAVASLPIGRRERFITAGIAFFLALLFGHPSFSERVPVEDPYVEALVPPIQNPQKAMILLTGQEPVGFLAPSLPPEIPLLRLDGWMYQAKDNTGLTRIVRGRIVQHMKQGGSFYLLADADQMTRAHDALQLYDLAIHWQKCRLFDTNISGSYQLCPLGRWPAGMPRHKGLNKT